MEKKTYSQVLKSGILNIENSYDYGWQSFIHQLINLLNSEKKIIIVDINGNIASGKSTFIDFIKDYFKKMRDIYIIKDTATKYENFDNYVKNPRQFAFRFQYWLVLDKEKQFKKVNKKIRKTTVKKTTMEEKKSMIIWDRSIYSDAIFFKLMKKNGFINNLENSAYQQKIDDLIKNGTMKSDLSVYFHSTPETCLERIKTRGIRSEIESYSYSYIKTIHDLHEDFFNSGNSIKNKLIMVNSNLDFEKIILYLNK
jgi:deoxyadenosine/deoxycytidine kinase